MNRKTKQLSFFTMLLILILGIEIIYIDLNKTLTPKKIDNRMKFVSISTTPDLAISTEANYIRHRSLSNIFEIYRDDPDLKEHFPSTFIYSHSHILNMEKIIEK